jgi:nucleotide-binding universal stress UspA family protein
MRLFETILVPVDFSINTEVAIKKAIELAVPGTSIIHLLHVLEKNVFEQMPVGINGMSIPVSSNKIEADNKLRELKIVIAERGNVHAESNVVISGKVEGSIVTVAKALQPDVIIIGKNNHHSFFPFLNTVDSTNIAESTACPVLTVKPGAINKKIKTVVMPVSDFFPKRKIELLAALCHNTNLYVHLLTILDNNQQPDHFAASALLQAMRTIRYKMNCLVQHCTIHSNNKAIATLHYAEKIGADMLLVNPEAETTISTWMSKKDITDTLKPASSLQVLSVQPYHRQ